MSRNLTQQPAPATRLKRLFSNQRTVALLALVFLFVFFCLAGNNFATYTTFVSILDSSYYIGFLAIGTTFIIITGGIDLSSGTVMVCCALISGTLIKMGYPVWPSLALCIVLGGVFGSLNGFMVAVMGLPAFIATLGTMMISRGLGSIITATASVTFPQRRTPEGAFRNIFKILSADTPTGGYPTGFILFIILAIIFGIILGKTRPGRYIMSLGSNKEATRLSGIDTVRWEMLAYIIGGLFAGLAGLSYAATYSTVLPGTGNGFELDAIAGTVIGGTSLSGGLGSISGTIIGVFIMSVLKTGLPFVGLQPHYQLLFTGIVLVIAVFVDVLNRRRQRT
ncbi:MAG: ABC transporter permease [Planctomycetota bacterium]|jgi:ribose transport system permease protein|nr:ABC transporter permease [Planctomycetota bacterium]